MNEGGLAFCVSFLYKDMAKIENDSDLLTFVWSMFKASSDGK